MIPHGVEGQRLMREFVLSNVCEQEKAWTQKYVKEEFEADDSLIDLSTGKLLKPVYKLYDVPLHSYKQGRNEIPGYSTYLFQATEAKAAIGKIKH